MTLYKGLDSETLEAEYNLMARRGPDFPQVVERWLARSALHRENSECQVDLAYGEGDREKLDLFYGGAPNGPVVIYIHGGYWQRGDKNMYSFITEGYVKHGVSVVMLNYNLTPSVRMAQIPPQIRKAVSWSWHNAEDLGFSNEKITVMGHSAGGHLTAMMMATDWAVFDPQLPSDLIRSGIPISGVFELEPLIHTSLNEGPQMSRSEAVAQSPCFIPPVSTAPQLVLAGAAETSEFLRQSDAYAALYRTKDRNIERYDVPDADHFDELERRSEENSVVFEKAMKFILR